MDIANVLSSEFGLFPQYVNNLITLLDGGDTVPFISRYRKEMHGSCDDQIIRAFADRLNYLRNLEKRKNEVQNAITDQGKWTDELAQALQMCATLTEVEDVYRPYKQKRKTRASVAIAAGLEPFANLILAQNGNVSVREEAVKFLSEEHGIESIEKAIQGAMDIIAEIVSDSAEIRKYLRDFAFATATLDVQFAKKENEKQKIYEMYKNFSEKIKTIPSHRVLAINRGETDECLKVALNMNKERAIAEIEKRYIKGETDCTAYIKTAIADSYERLLFPSIEREVRSDLTENASEQAIKMFEVNLRPLLMQAPLKNKVILGLDPAYRTGCKIAVIDSCGNVLDTAVVYPTPPQSKVAEATAILHDLINRHNVDVISIGNGTASKEAEIFVANLIKTASKKVSYAIVNEAGASVYSASKLGAEEFPEFDVSIRSAVSIARRLADPLSELIKIDVKSIGVGQYQHDMPQKRLSDVLGGVVEDCVNSVGVDLNTASVSLLEHISGLSSAVAKNIVEYRAKTPFLKRSQLTKVPKLGPKAYEQCAGFLRVIGGKNILDNTAVHPENYDTAEKLLKKFGYNLKDVADKKIELLKLLVEKFGEEAVAKELGIGVPTLNDLVAELLKPGRDIRSELSAPVLRSDIMDIKDLTAGMILNGTVRNVIDFGVFVDIGVHQDGLVHISEICKEFIKHPSEKLKVGEQVKVKVLGVDLNKNRISLTMKGVE